VGALTPQYVKVFAHPATLDPEAARTAPTNYGTAQKSGKPAQNANNPPFEEHRRGVLQPTTTVDRCPGVPVGL